MLSLTPQRGRRIFALYWSVIALVVVAFDYVSGPVIQFPAVFVIPVSTNSSTRATRWW